MAFAHVAECVAFLSRVARRIERLYGRESPQGRAAALRLAECRAANGDEVCARALALEPRAEFLLDYGTMLASYGNLSAAAGLLREA